MVFFPKKVSSNNPLHSIDLFSENPVPTIHLLYPETIHRYPSNSELQTSGFQPVPSLVPDTHKDTVSDWVLTPS